MNVVTKHNLAADPAETTGPGLSLFVPAELRELGDAQTVIPRLAKDEHSVQLIERAVQTIPTTHRLNLGDAREMTGIDSDSVHLVLTSPPYWTLKEYRQNGAAWSR